jgi:uncharacterized RDD family membrane protein YckC
MIQSGKSGAKTIPSSAERVIEAGLEQASFGRRLGATAIDHLIIWTLAIPLGYIIFPPDFFYDSGLFGTLVAGVLVALMLYYVFFTAWRGQTPGMRLCKIKVIDGHGRRPKWFRALWRESIPRVAMLISILIEGIFLCISNIVPYTLSSTTMNSYPERGYRKASDRGPVDILRFFDRLSGTYVVMNNKRSG